VALGRRRQNERQRLDLVHPTAEKITLVREGIGDDKIRMNSSSLDKPLTILPDQALEFVGIEKKVTVGRDRTLGLLADPRSERGGLRSGDQVTALRALQRRCGL
jgi:hypothetical protein